ncbi:hypothetical protein EON78_07415 [bacterium]|nr:MAG: hypothetical protein EON78_07415 [bacterium]
MSKYEIDPKTGIRYTNDEFGRIPVFFNKAEQKAAGFYDEEELTEENCSPELWEMLGGNIETDKDSEFAKQLRKDFEVHKDRNRN